MAQPSGTVIEIALSAAQTNVEPVSVGSQLLTNVTAIAAGGANLALRDNGTVIGWGWNQHGQATGTALENGGGVMVAGEALRDVVAISADATDSIAVRSNGTVVVWGADSSGATIKVPPGLTNAVAASAGWDHCLIVKQDGTVISLGKMRQPPGGLTNVVAVAAGKNYGFGALGDDLALKADGSVVGWALRGIPGASKLPGQLTNIVAIASGGAANFAMTRDGRVFGWGANDRGQATGIPSTNYYAQGYVTVGGRLLTNIVSIAAGDAIGLALARDGSVTAWGGVGTMGVGGAPRTLRAERGIVAIAAGEDSCLAVATNRVKRAVVN